MSDQPHVLLISTDHWAASMLGCAGNTAIQTPTLDQLAKNGVRFTNCYAECPVCIPARRTLMTGTTPRIHGDRVFKENLRMPDVPTVAQTFRDNGYQAYAVGKLHVYPQRDRIGFDDVILAEEGRTQFDAIDDYELFLGDQGHPGQMFGHGMCNNDYLNRPWHLAEQLHVTNWTTQNMARMIQRRDPTKPGFWFLSYCHPHPPLAPLQCYVDMYRDIEPPKPVFGDWSQNFVELPYGLQTRSNRDMDFTDYQIASAYRAFYAMCTHIDHQLRIVIGTLREERLLDNTIIMFTSDHGDMMGNHGQWAKRIFYEESANIPMLLVGPDGDDRVGHHRVEDRLVGWQDVMPTLLDLAGIDIPDSVDGTSMVGDQTRDYFYGECGESADMSRMIRTDQYKLIYYPTGNHTQLFDIHKVPQEQTNLAGSPDHADTQKQLTDLLLGELYGGDEDWVQDDELVGLPNQTFALGPNRGLSGQRGTHWPFPPQTGEGKPISLF